MSMSQNMAGFRELSRRRTFLSHWIMPYMTSVCQIARGVNTDKVTSPRSVPRTSIPRFPCAGLLTQYYYLIAYIRQKKFLCFGQR